MQDLNKLKPEELTPLSPEVISRQATINIGCASQHWVSCKASTLGLMIFPLPWTLDGVRGLQLCIALIAKLCKALTGSGKV